MVEESHDEGETAMEIADLYPLIPGPDAKKYGGTGSHPGGKSLYRWVLVPMVCISGQISTAWVYVGVPKHRERRSLSNGIWPE